MQEIEQSSVQFDYFSDNYQRFEADFYKYSNLKTPLTFLTDDILQSMASANTYYFKMNAVNALDHRDHYFIFRVKTPPQNKQLRIYEYSHHQCI